jgi:hypothetical protein
MEMEFQVANRDLSKQLMEMGVKQDSEFYWEMTGDNITTGRPEWTLRRGRFRTDFKTDQYSFSAFTVAELGEILPFSFCAVRTKPGELWRLIYHDSRMEYTGGAKGFRLDEYDSNTEADARAKMLIHLIKKGIVKP